MTTEAILLGTAQDAGVPQVGCYCATCERARKDPTQRQWVVCLGLVDHPSHQSWLIDATPDFREQVDALHQFAPNCPLAGIILTHAHMGHYTGLIQVGPEAMNVQSLPVLASPKMAKFLAENAPWAQLIQGNHISLEQLTPNVDVNLCANLRLRPVPVPHRDELSDTMAFVVTGPTRQLFYCPDIDSWDMWENDLGASVADVDIALLDGSFFSPIELPGRDIGQIPHPLVTDTAERLDGTDCEVRFIHLNHSNPLYRDGPERAWLTQRGLGVGHFGENWAL